MMVIAKMMNGKIVGIMKYADTVAFSKDRGWFMICYDFEMQNRRREQFKWIPADTRFEWARQFTE